MRRTPSTRSFPLAAFFLLVLAFLALPASPSRAESHPACQPSAETEALLADLDLLVLPGCSQDPGCIRAKIEENRRLVTEQPDNVHLQRNLQDLVHWYQGEDRSELLGRLSAYTAERAEKHPDDAAAHYLHGRMLDGEPQRAAYRRALEADPDFPWGHLVLAQNLYREDHEQALDHLRQVLRVCPETTVEPLLVSPMLPEAEIWKPRLEALHRSLRQEPLRRQLWGFPRLWAVEFQVVPPTEHAAVRERVREDIEILRRRDRPDVSAWWNLLHQGYEATGDTEALARLEEEVIEAQPCDREAVTARFKKLESQGGLPVKGKEPDPEALRQSWETASRWLEQCPKDFQYSSFHFAMAMRLGTLSDEEILAEIERHLSVWEMHESQIRMFTTPWGKAAEELLDRGLAPQRAVELAEKEVARAEKELEGRLREVEKQTADGSELSSIWIGALRGAHARVAVHDTLLARARFAAGNTQRAHEAVGAAEKALIEVRALETTYPEELYPPQHDLYAGNLVEVLAQQAEREGRTADALGLYQRAARLRPAGDKLRERPRELWSKLGGTDEGWEALTQQDEMRVAGETGGDSGDDETTGAWQRKEEPLPRFALTDMEGKTWTPEDLAGKTVLINLWATWCGPCRLELPYVHQLQQRIAEREDLAVVTLNADANPGLIQPFLEKNGYHFPVLLAEAFLMERYGGLSLPQTWIVDPEGVIRLRQRGFAREQGESWVDETLGKVESVAGPVEEPAAKPVEKPVAESVSRAGEGSR